MKKIIAILSAISIIFTLLTVTSFAAGSEIPYNSSWVVTDSSHFGNNKATLCFDDKPTSYCHSSYTVVDGKVASKDECPHTITVDFGETLEVSGWRYTPRTDNNNGTFKTYNIYASEDGNTFKKIFEGAFEYTGSAKDFTPSEASWGNVSMRAIKIEVVSSISSYGTCAEIDFLTGTSGTKIENGEIYKGEETPKADEKKEEVTSAEIGTLIPTNSSWTITESTHFGNNKATLCFDGNAKSYWHTLYTVEDGKVASKVECPHTITVDFGETLKVSGWKYTPRTDNASGTFTKYNIYASEDGSTFTKIYEGAFEYKAGPAADYKPSVASWGDVSMRAIKIEATTTISGYGTCAEINFFTGGSGKKIENGETVKESTTTTTTTASPSASLEISGERIPFDSAWKISATSEMLPWGVITRAFDKDVKTYWHTKYTAEGSTILSKDQGPFDVVVDFGEVKKVSGLIYTPRTDSSSGIVTGYKVSVSENGTDFKDVYTGKFDFGKGNVDKTPRTISWGDINAKAVKFTVIDSESVVATMAELEFLTGGKNLLPKEEVEKYASNGTPTLNRKGWKATINSDVGGSVSKIFDNKIETYWHSNYTHTGATVTGHDNPPYYLEVTLPEAKYISGIILAPRKDNSNGRILTTDILVSESDDGEFYCIYENYEFENTGVEKEILFASNILVKKVKLEINVTAGGYGTLAEFYLLTENEKFNKVSYDEFKENEDANRLYKLNAANMRAECDYLHWASNHVNNIFDGNTSSFWQTDHVPNGTIPPTLKIDLGSVQTFSRFDYTPRQSADCHGYWLNINMWGSIDGENWDIIEEGIDLGEKSMDTYVHNFEVPATARYLEIEFVEFNAQRIACAELVFYQTKADRDASGAGMAEKYELKIGSNTIKVTKGEESYEKTIDVAPYIVNGSTLIPLRGLLEEMGAEITWEAAKEKVHITKGNLKLTLQIWNKLVYADDPRFGEIRYTLLNYPVINNSRTFIPVRFVSEQLGYNVAWDGATQTITITSVTE